MDASLMGDGELEQALQSAVRAVGAAARIVRRHRHERPPAALKQDGSAVTEVDLRSEEELRRILKARHPDHAIVGEEGGFDPGTEGWVWYLDPLDGTRAFSIGQDNCSVAVTLTRHGLPLLAAVAAPFTGDTYTGVCGEPSRLNGRLLQARPPRSLGGGETLLYYDAAEAGRTALYGAAARGELGRLSLLPGSFILNACRAARGAHDLFAAIKRGGSPLMPWDLAPAALVLQGAGAVLHDMEGRSLGGLIPAREALAGRPQVVEQFRRQFGALVRDPRPALAWSRRNEPVFARVCSLLLGRGGCRVVGIAGAGGGIGKTSLARELAALLGAEECRILSLDDYLIPRQDRDRKGMGAHDPAAVDLESAAADLAGLRRGRPCIKPVYDHVLGASTARETVQPARFLIVEGVHALQPLLRSLLDVAIFLDAVPAVRYQRVARDMEEKKLAEPYARGVQERFEADIQRFLLPLRDTADVVLQVEQDFQLTWLRPCPAGWSPDGGGKAMNEPG